MWETKMSEVSLSSQVGSFIYNFGWEKKKSTIDQIKKIINNT